MKKYTVNSPLNHDLRPYAIGDTVEMSEAQAAHLVALGRITLVEAEAAPGKEAGLQNDAAQPPGADADTAAAAAAAPTVAPAARPELVERAKKPARKKR